MSSLYNLEPQPTAKVVLSTTSGDLTLELFAKQIPLASRNFLQHCLDGYYNNTVFHRLVPGFIIQGGDPTGTGHGGTSAVHEDGSPFADEFHSRLKFNRRGLLGMANDGADQNGSQFFLTLGATAELQGKHTMFGRIEGETIYNLMKMGEAEVTEVEGSERPMYPTRITGAEVLVNPFEDMVVRVREAPRTKQEAGSKKDAKKRKKPAGKNVLSFGGDDGDEDAAPVLKRSKVNPRFASADEQAPSRNDREAKAPTSLPTREPAPEIRLTSPEGPQPVKAPARLANKQPVLSPPPFEPPEPEPQLSALDKINAEIAATKASMKREVDTGSKQEERPKGALEAMIPETASRGRKRGKASDEKGAMDIFNSFRQKLANNSSAGGPEKPRGGAERDAANGLPGESKADAGAQAEGEDEEASLCDLHFIANCQSCKAWDGDENADAEAETDNDTDWMSHTLTFAKDVLGKDLEWKRKMEEIEVIDPREKARAIAQSQKDRRKEKPRS
ncbi:cyclophilin-like protein [Polychaeton citri CBS 116435]|uniref:Cyclophilin-like protein n=1 Tax=Polychaeton citri CBS 116435 TaxID=1314669 RepID=A0A9P4Q9H0_9PEZI|nr:cyclophilin-like protein [Polychaeton citri CBS 116435]